MSTSAEPAAGVTPAEPGSPAANMAPAAPSEPISTDQGTPGPDQQTARLTAEVAAWRKKHAALEKQFTDEQAKHMSEADQALVKAKEDGAAEYRDKYQQAIGDNAALRLLSDPARGISSPALALKALDLSGVDIDPATGTVDQAALAAAVDQLLIDFPMLCQPHTPGVPSINGGSQQRVTSNQLAQVGDRDKLNEQLRWALRG